MHKMYPLFLASYNEKMHVHNKNRHRMVTANQTSGQKNKPRSTSAQSLYLVHHNELL